MAAKLDWSELDDPQHQRVLAWHRQLIALRRHTRALGAGALLGPDVRCSEKECWITLRRGALQIAAHIGSETASIPVDRFAQLRIALASGASQRLTGDRLELAPDSFAVLAPL
jgi:maltooligosyltrehalose trehalohydrolase